jgi:ABC-type glutathione transport system ATPase component
VQDQVIRLLRTLDDEAGMAILLITHNLALVASLCDRIIALYAGHIVESGPAETLFRRGQGRRRRVVHHPRRRDARPGGRVRLRQIDVFNEHVGRLDLLSRKHLAPGGAGR